MAPPNTPQPLSLWRPFLKSTALVVFLNVVAFANEDRRPLVYVDVSFVALWSFGFIATRLWPNRVSLSRPTPK